VSKTTGVRLVMVSTTLTSRDRVKEIEKEWQALGSGRNPPRPARHRTRCKT
jgi:hypothetical protein